ncbi:MAG: hypothetical protein LBN97_05235 [Oscillospiraceae bacterium]|jgi:hypothetical protein|nr:hypothetical protein [Oscillospiraceae bacterium]
MLFREDIEPACAYCSRSAYIADNEYICRRRGIVEGAGECRGFVYDPFRRIPPENPRLTPIDVLPYNPED